MKLQRKYRSNFEGVVWPPILRGEVAKVAALVDEFERSQWMSEADLKKHQFEQLAVLAEHSSRHSEWFRHRLARAKLSAQEFASPERFCTLPVMTRRHIKLAGDSLFCQQVPPAHGLQMISKSSGSTGEPIAIRRTELNHIDWMALSWREHNWYKRDFSLKYCGIKAGCAAPIHMGHWGTPVRQFIDSGPCLVLPVAMKLSELALRVSEFEPSYLQVFPSILNGLAEEYAKNGHRFQNL